MPAIDVMALVLMALLAGSCLYSVHRAVGAPEEDTLGHLLRAAIALAMMVAMLSWRAL